MKDELHIKEAFDQVRAEDALLERVSSSVLHQMGKRRSPGRTFARMAAAAACMVVLFFAGYGTRAFFQLVSVISIDINPSLELGVNTLDRVISVRGFNPEGEALADSLKLTFLTSTDAVERIVSSDTVTSLLNREEELFITVVGEDVLASSVLCQELEDSIDQSNSQCQTAPMEHVADAHHCGLSYGKYLAYLEAQEENGDLTAEDVRDMTMRQIRELTGTHHGKGHHAVQETEEPEEPTLPTELSLPAETACEPQNTHKHSGHKRNHH